MKLFSALYKDGYPFMQMGLFKELHCATWPHDLHGQGALVVWGGGDISPTLYNRNVSRRTQADKILSKRDWHEWELMKRARERGMPIIGVCRGAQMLCALAGGFLVQDITHHAIGAEHPVITDDGRSLSVSSLHHQMLYPFDVEHKMIAWAPEKLSRHYIDCNESGEDVPIDVPLEPEFVYFPKEKGIAIQWHPEYMKVDCDANVYVKEKVRELLDGS